MTVKKMLDSFVLDGQTLGATTDFRSLIREQLKDGSVWPSGDSGREQGVRRVLDAARGTAVEKPVLQALLALVTDGDVKVRTEVVSLIWDYADRFRGSELLQALEEHTSLYEGIKPVGVPETYMPDLAWGLIQAMNASRNPDDDVIKRLRQAAEDASNGFRVFGGLARHDSAWLIDHASALVSGQPARARIILANLGGRQSRERFARVMASESASVRQELVSAVAEKLRDPDERQRLTEILSR